MTDNNGIHNYAGNKEPNASNDPLMNASQSSKKRPWQSKLFFSCAAFLGGVGVTVYLLSHWQPAQMLIAPAPASNNQQASEKVAQLPPQLPLSGNNQNQNGSLPLPQTEAPAPNLTASIDALNGRVDRLENRIDDVSKDAKAAIGDAGRAESLLVAFAARRALNRGQPLGYLEGLLQSRFGNSQQQAVSVILNASRQPVTLEQLVAGLATLKTDLLKPDKQQGWLSYFRQFFSNLFVIHRRGEISTMPSEQLEEAIRFLNNGNVDGAIADITKLPGARYAQNWLVAAKRYALARNALDILETSALLSPDHPGVDSPAPDKNVDSLGEGEKHPARTSDNHQG
ncbi:hypothetical protein FBY58_0045 [Zymomonas mobilis]|uniref:Inner membrane protein n=1 Tax=Zymomonas mobilis TaxID=542 RepID=A0A542VYW4_ZYMMB|nr:hypothetical protein [Zymomonas mobilis]TQL16511.1 hypothetical protein FBY58_0045 [Zymomonas mobilis]